MKFMNHFIQEWRPHTFYRTSEIIIILEKVQIRATRMIHGLKGSQDWQMPVLPDIWNVSRGLM